MNHPTATELQRLECKHVASETQQVYPRHPEEGKK
jgi:hypothetical protein